MVALGGAHFTLLHNLEQTRPRNQTPFYNRSFFCLRGFHIIRRFHCLVYHLSNEVLIGALGSALFCFKLYYSLSYHLSKCIQLL